MLMNGCTTGPRVRTRLCARQMLGRLKTWLLRSSCWNRLQLLQQTGRTTSRRKCDDWVIIVDVATANVVIIRGPGPIKKTQLLLNNTIPCKPIRRSAYRTAWRRDYELSSNGWVFMRETSFEIIEFSMVFDPGPSKTLLLIGYTIAWICTCAYAYWVVCWSNWVDIGSGWVFMRETSLDFIANIDNFWTWNIKNSAIDRRHYYLHLYVCAHVLSSMLK